MIADVCFSSNFSPKLAHPHLFAIPIPFARWHYLSHCAQSHTINKHTNGLYMIARPSQQQPRVIEPSSSSA